jgi:hypothetical protein
VTPYERYTALGPDDASRRSAYRELFRDALSTESIDRIRRATNTNDTLGNRKFAPEQKCGLQLKSRKPPSADSVNMRRCVDRRRIMSQKTKSEEVFSADGEGAAPSRPRERYRRPERMKADAPWTRPRSARRLRRMDWSRSSGRAKASFDLQSLEVLL